MNPIGKLPCEDEFEITNKIQAIGLTFWDGFVFVL
jgi:hypothetical protein